uniref:Uncharacterized protein n=1 Tax=Strombidinopsis acuminata TaxID=141414 RepID=A0A7S3T5Y1_9SPIT|eukprot:scaffold239544_cov28-Tisochrysis_lutea.AAC.1
MQCVVLLAATLLSPLRPTAREYTRALPPTAIARNGKSEVPRVSGGRAEGLGSLQSGANEFLVDSFNLDTLLVHQSTSNASTTDDESSGASSIRAVLTNSSDSSSSAEVTAAAAAVAALAAVGFDVWALNGELGLVGMAVIAAAVAGTADDASPWGSAVRAIGGAANMLLKLGLSAGDEENVLEPERPMHSTPTEGTNESLRNWLEATHFSDAPHPEKIDSFRKEVLEKDVRQAIQKIESACLTVVRARISRLASEAAALQSEVASKSASALALEAMNKLERALETDAAADFTLLRAREHHSALKRSAEEAMQAEITAVEAVEEAQAILTRQLIQSTKADDLGTSSPSMLESIQSSRTLAESTLEGLGPVRDALSGVEARTAKVFASRTLVARSKFDLNRAADSVSVAVKSAEEAMRALEEALKCERQAQESAAVAEATRVDATAKAVRAREEESAAMAAVDEAQSALSSLLLGGVATAEERLARTTENERLDTQTTLGVESLKSTPIDYTAQDARETMAELRTGDEHVRNHKPPIASLTPRVPRGGKLEKTTIDPNDSHTPGIGHTPPMMPRSTTSKPNVASSTRGARLRMAISNLGADFKVQKLLEILPECESVEERVVSYKKSTRASAKDSADRSSVIIVLEPGATLSSGAVSHRIREASGGTTEARASIVLQPLIAPPGSVVRSINYSRSESAPKAVVFR